MTNYPRFKGAAFYVWIGVLLVMLAVGADAFIARSLQGLGITALNNMTPWGLWISLYIFFIGLSAGAFLISTLTYVFGARQFEKMGRYAVLTAAICMVVALSFILPDLGRMLDRWYYMLIYRQYLSFMQIELNFYFAYILILVLEIFFLTRNDLAIRAQLSSGVTKIFYSLVSLRSRADEVLRSRDAKIVKILGAIGIPVAVGVHGGTGAIFAIVKAKPAWFSPLMPIVFLASALASGGALALALYVITSRLRGSEIDRELVRSASKLLAFLLVLDWFFVFWEILVPGYAASPEEVFVIDTIMYGPFSWVFWTFEIALGLVLPVVLLVASKFRKPWVSTLACLFIVAGIIGVRLNIVVPAFFLPPYSILTLGEKAGIYFPSNVEWLSSLFFISGALLLYSIGVKLLPMESLQAEGQLGGAFGDPQLKSSFQMSTSRRNWIKAFVASLVAGAGAFFLPKTAAHREGQAAHGFAGKRWAMLIDLARCTGCQSCVVACKTENNVALGTFRRWVPDVEVGTFPNTRRLFLPLLCNHCDSPPCVPVCPVDATWRRDDGIVVVDWDRCIGCRYCMVACPYAARDFDWNGTQMVDKCTFCAHRLDQGLLPACVEQCPAEAMIFGDLNDANSEISRIVRTREVQVLKPELGTKPRVFYLGLPSSATTEVAMPQPSLEPMTLVGLNIPWMAIPGIFVRKPEQAESRVILGNKFLSDPRLYKQVVVSGEKVEMISGE